MICPGCESDRLVSVTDDDIEYAVCTHCCWFQSIENYDKMVREALEKALEEA